MSGTLCLVAGSAFGQINGRIWYDSNRDGIQDPGEPGVASISVAAFDGLTCTGVPISSTTSDGNGDYSASVASIGAYCLQFSDIPAGWTITLQDQGLDESLDSDANPVSAQVPGIVLPQSEAIADMGLHAAGSIGGTVWCDGNDNLLFDAGEGLAGVTVRLQDDGNCDALADALIATQVTAGDGQYLFTGVPAGPPAGPPRCYVVTADPADLGTCSIPLDSASGEAGIDASAPDELDVNMGFTSRQQQRAIPGLGPLGILFLAFAVASLGCWLIHGRL